MTDLRSIQNDHDSAADMRPTADVTVIVVAYSHAQFIEECLDSIRAQTTPPRRVLIADDASPDATDTVIREYLEQHPGWAEYHPNAENRGLNPTLNAMLAITHTQYVTYIAADDFMYPHRIEEHVKLMESDPCAVLAYSDAAVVDEHSNLLSESSQDEFPWPEDEWNRRYPFEELLSTNWMPAASLFLRTDRLKALGSYHDHLFYEDFELLVRLSKQAPFAFTEEPLVAVRRLSTSLGAIGFRGDSPRFITALDTALRHYEGTSKEIQRTAFEKRWALAKRAIATDMPRRNAMQLLWHSRRGASSPAAFVKHMVRAVWTVWRPPA
ncbi:glycosyltransferase family 2 protein [Micrococcus terreus]|uniref:glycosyltransferase family 2 protein n=1 Tax=Micrococcus terreus TaxID=574650 RepID=UPI0023F84D7B|nr:glycosyltransferase family A protein [Micrococcus terreus]